MLTVRATIVLLVLVFPPCRGQESDCSCNITNGRCDEVGVCRCDPGWDGDLCDLCLPSPGCLHGNCEQPWQCRCEEGWGGRFCDKDLSVCLLQQPCQNGATCVMEDSGDFRCLCPEGFHGSTCQRRWGPCHQRRSPCKNGGQCEDSDGFAVELTCRCLSGFTGHRCETNVDDCLMRPCANGATCLDGINRFSCVCPAGFTGRFCTVNVDDCASRPCLNAGRCLDLARGFRCVCGPGFTGATCQKSLRAGDAHESSWTMLGWEGEGGEGGGQTTGRGNSSRHGDGLLKVTVSERRDAGLSRLQLTIVLSMAATTLGVAALTATLVLQGRCRDCGHAPSVASSTQGQKTPARDQCQISLILNAEAEKKKLNSEVI